MREFIIISLILCVFNFNVCAKGKCDDRLSRMTFGLEWGYIAAIHSGFHYSYFAPEGYRIEDSGNSFAFTSNAGMYVHCGYDFNPLWNLSLYIGYEGIGNFHKAVPVSLRITRYFNPDPDKDRWFSFADFGSGICMKKPVQEILTGKIGGGYSLSLSRRTSLDFLLSARFTYTHPQIFYDGVYIPFSNINRNAAYMTAISLGMAITF